LQSPKKNQLSNLVVRSIAGILFTTTVIGSALLGPWALGALFFLFCMVGLNEFLVLSKSTNLSVANRFYTFLGGVFIYLTTVMVVIGEWSEAVFLLMLPYTAIVASLSLVKPDQQASDHLGRMLFSWVYVVAPFSMVLALAYVSGDFLYELPLGFFVILWINDSGAYFVGRWLGKRKLYPSISPNKTWEGLMGGITLSLLAGAGIAHFFDQLESVHWMVMAASIAILANVGDLFESLLKRSSGVKDSGKLIPGHGGALDRFDGLLIALPVVYVYLYFIFHL
jgi:phosphatidate cytidylyltransferase